MDEPAPDRIIRQRARDDARDDVASAVGATEPNFEAALQAARDEVAAGSASARTFLEAVQAYGLGRAALAYVDEKRSLMDKEVLRHFAREDGSGSFQAFVASLRVTAEPGKGTRAADARRALDAIESLGRIVAEAMYFEALTPVPPPARPEVYPRRGGPCDHRSCRGAVAGCRAYADEVVTPTDEDTALAQQLVAEGWWSTSRRYCTIARWKEPAPTVEQIRTALVALAGEFHGNRLADVLRVHEEYKIDHRRSGAEIEERTITPAQMLAFKRAGGEPGR